MSTIIIKHTPRFDAELEKLLKHVQRTARVRTLTAVNIHQEAATAEDMLKQQGVPLRLRTGARYRLGPPCMQKSYKYPAASTTLEIIRRATGWEVTDISRERTWPVPYGRARSCTLNLPPKALDHLLSKSQLGDHVAGKHKAAYEAGLAVGVAKATAALAPVPPAKNVIQLSLPFPT